MPPPPFGDQACTMVVLRLHFQVTGHKQPILAVGAHGDLLATAEHGAIRLWSFGASRAAAGGPSLLGAFPCSRQPVRALFVVPGVGGGGRCSCVVGVFEQDGVVLFDVRGGGVVERHVLLHHGDKKWVSCSTYGYPDTIHVDFVLCRQSIAISLVHLVPSIFNYSRSSPLTRRVEIPFCLTPYSYDKAAFDAYLLATRILFICCCPLLVTLRDDIVDQLIGPATKEEICLDDLTCRLPRVVD